MTKLVTVVIAVVALSALTLNAAIITDPNAGALKMKLTVDAAGNATLSNISGANLLIDTYEIWSSQNTIDPGISYVDALGDPLDPMPAVTGWVSLEDSATLNFVALKAAIGTGGTKFGQSGPGTSGLISELNLTSAGTFKPNAPWSIGQALNASHDPTKADLTFYFTTSGTSGNKWLGVVEDNRVPEPATMGLLVVGGIGMLLKRKR